MGGCLRRGSARPAVVGGAARSHRRHAPARGVPGREAITLPGSDRHIADDVIAYAQANNVTQIVIGKSVRTRWFEILHGSVVHDLVRRSGNISVHVIAGDTIAGAPVAKKTLRPAKADDTFDARP